MQLIRAGLKISAQLQEERNGTRHKIKVLFTQRQTFFFNFIVLVSGLLLLSLNRWNKVCGALWCSWFGVWRTFVFCFTLVKKKKLWSGFLFSFRSFVSISTPPTRTMAQSLSLSFLKKSDFWELLTFIYLFGAWNLAWSCKNVQKHEPDESHIKYKLKHTSGCQTKVVFPQRDVITAPAAPPTKSTDQSNTVVLLQTGRINPPELWEAARKAQTPADNLRWPPLLAVAASDPLPPPAGSGGCRPIRERLGARGAFRR